MQFYTYGNSEKPVMLLLPGTCCHHKTFDYVVPYLQEHFYVIVASYDGFDETEQTTFPDMTAETEKIEAYILERFNGKIFAAYGCSLGGSFVGLLIQRKRIHIEHGFIGSSDLDQADGAMAKAEGAIVAPIMFHILQKGKLPAFVEKRFSGMKEHERQYINDFLKFFGIGEGALDMSFVTKTSIYNQFYSDLVTPLEDAIDVEGTTVHIFYALKMGDEYETRYLKHFRNPDIRRHNLQHEELLVRLPEVWTKEILDCCAMEGGEAYTGAQDPATVNRQPKKILIYGAGTIGCYLAHILLQRGHDVTLLARGSWKEKLEKNGMILHHILQNTNTVDHPVVIGEVSPQDSFDVVFAPLQQSQLLAAAPELGKIHAPLIVCVGNNLHAAEVQHEILVQAKQQKEASALTYPEKILFAFQGTSGCRKGTIAETLHLGKGDMSIGALSKAADPQSVDLINGIFEETGFQINWQPDMDSWLWCHMAFILPLAYVSYTEKCNLRTMSARQMDLIMDAAGEGMELLKECGYQILPEGEDTYYVRGSAKRKSMDAFMRLVAKTKFGEYCVTDHCRHAAAEMHVADLAWKALREKHIDMEMPAWETLRQAMPSWEEIEAAYSTDTRKQKPDYKNWMPKGMVAGIFATAGVSAVATTVAAAKLPKGKAKTASLAVLGTMTAGAAAAGVWSLYGYNQFSYNGKRRLSADIINAVAEHVQIPDGGKGLDVGCGSGALTIACAKKNPNARMLGIDRWGKEYASFSKLLCQQNADAENVTNIAFENGNAVKLDYPDETFDCVTSNYVYHNIPSKDRQALLLETLRVLKKGGTFAIHDIMTPARYGNMQNFVTSLRGMGYEEVKLIRTDNGNPILPKEAALIGLTGSTLLIGRK